MFKTNMIQLIQRVAFYIFFLAEPCVNQVGLSTPSMLKSSFVPKHSGKTWAAFPSCQVEEMEKCECWKTINQIVSAISYRIFLTGGILKLEWIFLDLKINK